MTSPSAALADRWLRGQRSAAALAALCCVLACASVRAQSPELVELTWDAPAGCPGAADVQARIRRLAASARPTGTALRAEGTITRKADGGLHLKLVIRAGELVGERNLEGRSCEDLAGAASVNLALLLSSQEPLSAADVGGPPTVSSPADQASQPNAAEPAKAQPAATGLKLEAEEPKQPKQPEEREDSEVSRASVVDAPSARAWRALLDVPLASLELGPMPRPSFGGALAAGVLLDRWRILAEGGLWLRQELTVKAPAGVGAAVDRLDAGLRACRAFPFGRFELAPCLIVSLQHVSARGTGAHVVPQTAESTWVAAGAGVQARLQLVSWLSLLASVDARVEGSRPRITIDGVGRVGQLGPAAVKMVIGPGWIL